MLKAVSSAMPERGGARAAAPLVEQLLVRIRDGDRAAVDELFTVLYDELYGIAGAQRRRWSGDYTLNTTAVLHEAYVKLAGGHLSEVTDRRHFMAIAARAMRQVLVNYAERRRARKRQTPTAADALDAVVTDDLNPVDPEAADEIVALHTALARLEQVSERQCRVVECRFFAGLPVRDTAEVLGISPATVKRDWALASAWLYREIRTATDP